MSPSAAARLSSAGFSCLFLLMDVDPDTDHDDNGLLFLKSPSKKMNFFFLVSCFFLVVAKISHRKSFVVKAFMLQVI